MPPVPDGGVSDDHFAPLTAEMLEVGDGHRLYVETVGNAAGRPAVYLHGGPGSGCQPDHRRLFDPDRMRVVLFDQRGAGRSTPHGERRANTTAHLVGDMERIRAHLGIARWLVVGGSWGATLALAYAEAYPERVSGLVLRATFLGTRAELDWAFGSGPATFRPELYRDFLSLLSEEERRAPLDAYFRRILDPDPTRHGPAARAFAATERLLSQAHPATLRLDFDALAAADEPLPPTAFMEAYYFTNACFLAPDQLLRDAGRLAGISGIVIQGQHDLLCPPSTAFSLADRWRGAEVKMVPGAGHSLSEPGIAEAMRVAIAAWSG